MRAQWVLWLAVTGCHIEADELVTCGDLLCPANAACVEGACQVPPAGPVKFTADLRTVRGELTDVPLLLVLEPSSVDYDAINDPYQDLSIKTVDGIDVPFEVERWAPQQRSYLWIRVPRLVGGDIAEALVVEGGTGLNGASTGASVVWPEKGTVLHDLPANAMASGGATSAPGWISGAISLTSDTSTVVVPNARVTTAWPGFTLQLWFYAESEPIPGVLEPIIFDLYPTFLSGRLISYGAAYTRFQIDVGLSPDTQYLPVLVETTTWTHIVLTFDGSILREYRDGALSEVQPGVTGTLTPSIEDLTLGNSKHSLHGTVDEFRLLDRVFTKDEVRAMFLADSQQLFRPL